MGGLVAVRQEAVVAAGLAGLAPQGAAAIVSVRSEVAQVERGPGGGGEGAGLVDEAAQHARPALGRLEEEQGTGRLGTRHGLGAQLRLLQLEGHLEGVVQGHLERDHRLRRERAGGLDEQAVSVVLHVRDNPAGARAHGVLRVVQVLVAVAGPRALVDVQHEAGLGVGPPAPAQVDPPQFRRVAVRELGEDIAVAPHHRRAHRERPVALHEPERRLHLEALPAALLLVGADAVPAASGHVVEPE